MSRLMLLAIKHCCVITLTVNCGDINGTKSNIYELKKKKVKIMMRMMINKNGYNNNGNNSQLNVIAAYLIILLLYHGFSPSTYALLPPEC